ncbi:DUF2515 family protein [Fictibacillus phosphorivorans]|uniref:DUF2515 family protein n=1 Tax=Fictibacillus phosphorivorans TaxID=1221500 RepID=UPI0020424E28|nr:DUF2515 family protein [Fictibacillus phosphorivorans]MCM3719303.1 DUF2515 domain-containing protein [Fictibacillus phosphorivorans]MCM3776925.1 DUF2515 domain-containing protein [Fictibacillus phosphorivorans]
MKRKKVIWKVSPVQEQKLRHKWNKISKYSKKVSITFQKDKELIERIKRETLRHNKNNVTRTAAYLNFFNQHPEVHWAFLAHMVSRNAGYFMTDLKGEFLPDLIEPSVIKELYTMLEKGNSLIFHDAYPQLLLYEESKRRNSPVFNLCKFFHVSSFMEGVWEVFFEGDRTSLLPAAQIINEQNHIDMHLIRTEPFQKLHNQLSFKLQEWLHLSQILFPVLPLHHSIGDTMQGFENLNKRLMLGQNLYVMLFHPDHLDPVKKFACHHPHTGSRSDYDSDVFSFSKSHNGHALKEKLSLFKTKKSLKLYSPKLDEAWDTNYHGPFPSTDWFTQSKDVMSQLRLISKPSPQIRMAYWAGLHQIETAYLLKQYYRLIKKIEA